ncbi:hypothetical protein ILUMI_18645 [Ignelater luminosus]|uniref:Odorant receptor n=1 Tax=Ignelater luminosus TaxID=2038154 RepID=A0A8K0CHL2_IGNLU|nr:hypothetical protein ILUMI_18645 [Ignelater luminosus]
MNIERGAADFVRNLEGVFAYAQQLGKVSVTIYYFNDLKRLLETTKLFWKPNMCNQRTETTLNSMYSKILQLQKFFLMTIAVTAVPLMLVLLLEKVPAIGIWTLKGHDTLYHFVIAEQIIYMPYVGVLVWAFECMYLGFCVEIIVQFKILSHHLEKLTTEGSTTKEKELNYLEKINACIRHHQLMLWFIKKFRQIFSLLLLTEYLTAGPLICAELFAAFEGQSYRNKMRHIFIFFALAFQLGSYCIPADYVTDEALSVSYAIYSSKWYANHFPSLKVPLLLMMQNAQQEITIRAGGLVVINTQTFVTVLKVAWSACSIARGLRQN